MNIYLCLLLMLVSCSNKEPSSNLELKLKATTYGDPYSVIAHAGGGIGNEGKPLTYTNSLEAINNSILDGKKLIEVDLIITSDNIIVGGHDWDHTIEISNSESIFGKGQILSHSEFKSLTIYEKYTPIDLNDINQILQDNIDVVLVTDKIKDYDLLLAQFDFLDRLIVECFSINECYEAKNKGIGNVAYSISITNTAAINDFIDHHFPTIKMVTISAKAIKNDAKALKNAQRLFDLGVINLAYSANDDDFIVEHIGSSVNSFYTDFWMVKSKKCIKNCGIY